MYISKLLVFLIGIKCASCANILYVAPVPSPSHHIWNRALALSLIEKGHNITMIGHDAEKTKINNFHIILFEGVYEKLYQDYHFETMFDPYPIIWIMDMYKYIVITCKLDMETEGLRTLMNYPKDFFDIILFDATCGQCLYPLIDVFNRPVVAVTPFLLPNYLANAMGTHWFTSYMPHFGMPSTNKMSFFERVSSFCFKNAELFIRNYYYMDQYEKLARSYFGKNIRQLEKYEQNFTLLLSNSDPILDFPIAVPPNIIPVGGLHIKLAKLLPNDLQKIMDSAKDGVILFSLGSNVRSDQLSTEIRKSIIEALGKLKEIVLWKFESELEGLPKNVIIRKWLPQNDILSHPKTKLFISHGGALSTQESMYHGVPVLGIPFFFDQHNNMHKMVSRKFSLSITSFKKITADILYENINEMLTNPIYSQNIKKLSKKFKDQPQTPIERGIFWIEHVLKHGPLDEFALPTNGMNLFKIYSLDVIAFFFVMLTIFFLAINKLIRKVCCKKLNNKDKLN